MHDEEHDIDECEKCEIRELDVNGHAMEVIIPCNEFGVYWFCSTCDLVEFWQGCEPLEAFNEIMHVTLYIHCADALALNIQE